MTFQTLLPSNATKLELDIEQSVSRIQNLPVEDILKIWSPNDCPLNFLFWLGRTFSVEIWKHDWPEETKREMLRNSLEIHFHKGTKFAVRKTLEILGIEGFEIREWFETTPPGQPYTFEVLIPINDPEFFQIGNNIFIKTAIENTKPVRSGFTLVSVLGLGDEGLKSQILFMPICRNISRTVGRG